jgi:hypothetical protein
MTSKIIDWSWAAHFNLKVVAFGHKTCSFQPSFLKNFTSAKFFYMSHLLNVATFKLRRRLLENKDAAPLMESKCRENFVAKLGL